MKTGIWSGVSLFLCLCIVSAGEVWVEQGTSSVVWLGADGQLQYARDEQGNRIPDFSYVGYHAGEKPIPVVPVVQTLAPEPGDDTGRIQAALDRIGARPVQASGFRGALLLQRGTYHVDGTLSIGHSGIVLRGEGDGPDGTVIVATGYGEQKYKRTLLSVGNNTRIALKQETHRAITDDYVPVGTHQFSVSSSKGYQVGDRIVLYRPSTEAWIAAIGCDNLSPRWTKVRDVRWVKEGPAPGLYYQRGGISHPQRIPKRPDESWAAFTQRVPVNQDETKIDVTRQWKPGTYDLYFERQITDITGNRVTIDAPVVHPMEQQYGGGAIYQYAAPGRVYEVGIENLRLMSEFADPVPGHPYGDPAKRSSASERHAWHAIVLQRNTENIWVRNITAQYFGWSVVSAKGTGATVQDCVSLGHASRITGGRRYPFMISGQRNLVQRCLTYEGRHEFVTQARTAGPNVFVDCLGKDTKSSAGPHHRYSVGTLFDTVQSEHFMESRFRDNSGTGHGWAGTQTCFYNCIAPGFRVGAPPGGMAWVLGSTPADEQQQGRLQPSSLYYQQLGERLGREALDAIAPPHYRQTLGQFKWAKHKAAK